MDVEEEEARVRQQLLEMKQKLEESLAEKAKRQSQLQEEEQEKGGPESRRTSRKHSVRRKSTLKKTFVPPRSQNQRHHHKTYTVSTLQGKGTAFKNPQHKSKQRKPGQAGFKRQEQPRARATYPWRQKPTRVKKITFLVGKARKMRGLVAKSVHIPSLLQVIANPVSQFFFEITLCVMIYVYFFITTYQAFFDLSDDVRTWIICGLDYFFMACGLVRLVTEWWRYALALEYSVLFIPCTPRFWLAMLVCLAPLDYIASFFLGDSLSEIEGINWLKFNRWFMLLYVQVFVTALDEGHYVTSVTAFFLKFAAVFTAFLHVVACLLFWITGGSPMDTELSRNFRKLDDTWIGDGFNVKYAIIPSSFSAYMLSLSLSTATMLTTGYADLAPKRESEMLLSVFVMLVGAIGLAGYFNSRLTGFFLVVDGARNQLFRRLNLIVRHLKSLNAPAILVFKVREYYDCLWNFRKGVHRVDSIRKLPGAMYEDILYDICAEMFNKALLFRGLEEPFLRQVAKTVEILIYNPDMIVCRQGTPASAMYFIIQGEIAVKHPVTARYTRAILRPGCIFGETRLFFSMNNPANIETRTCCQLLVIRKDKLLNIGLKNPTSLNIMRARMSERLRQLHEEYELKGIPPVVWVRRRKAKRGKDLFYPGVDDFSVSLRWASWFNRPVSRLDADMSIAAAGNEVMIVDMPSTHYEWSTDLFVTYGDCVIPMTLLHPDRFISFWHVLIAVLTVPHVLATAHYYGFSVAASGEDYFFALFRFYEFVMSMLYLVDLMIEIFTAAPVTGLYYKLWDGLRVCRRRLLPFLVNVVSVVPLFLVTFIFDDGIASSLIHLVLILFGRYCKMIKVVRYLHYLSETHPASVPLLRLLNITVWLGIHAYFIGALLFWTAYSTLEDPQFPDFKFSWVASYYIRDIAEKGESKSEYEPNQLLNHGPITISVYYAVATFTNTGIGDFSPQTIWDIAWSVLWQVFAFFMLGILAAQLTSGLASASLPRVTFEGQLSSFRRFFQLHGLSMRLRDRIVEHYKLQYQLNEGIPLPPNVKHLMYDAPPYLSDDALFAELSVPLEGIPVFTNCDPKTLIAMAKNMNIFLLPPNITFVRRGEVRRQMYIISKGSMAIMDEDTIVVKSILVETGHFGLRDLLYGEPSLNNIKTLSYCLIYSIDLASFNDIMQEDEDLMDMLTEERRKLRSHIRRLNMIFLRSQNLGNTEFSERKPSEIPSWITFPTQPGQVNEWCSYEEFDSGYKGTLGIIAKYLLMRRAVHPAGTFALLWCLVTAFGGLVAFLQLMLELLPQYLTSYFGLVEIPIEVLFAADVYVRLHWGFYTDSNHLICHPLQTAKHYLMEGQFLFSYFFEIVPVANIMLLLGAVNVHLLGEGFRWAISIQAHRLVHTVRVPIFVRFGRHVGVARTIVLCFIYMTLTLCFSSFLACLAIYFACPWESTRYEEDLAAKLPACFAETWVDAKPSLRSAMQFGPPRWLLAIYFVLQVTFGVGYGDQATLKFNEVVMVIFLMIFGYVATRCIISDMTATAVGADEIRTEFLEKMKRITTVMEKQEVDRGFIERIQAHLQYEWLQSRGLEPQQLFNNMHPALLGDFYREYIGDSVASVPLLAGQSDNVLRYLCTHMKKLYFVRGDVIARRNCLELEMYIIVEGTVWVTGQDLDFQCELGPGETFGETQMLFGVVRKFSAIAANNVEVFALTALSFADILDHYPSLKYDILQRMHNKKADLYERKIHYMNNELGSVSAEEAETIKDRLSERIRKILSYDKNDGSVFDEEGTLEVTRWQKVKRFIARWLISWGPDDTNLPFLYLATGDNATKPSLLLHPRCGFQRHFSTLIIVLCWLSSAIAIYLMFFGRGTPSKADKDLLDFSHLIEIPYWIHIFLTFFTPFVTVEGKYCKEHCSVIFRNLFNFSYFWLDLFSAFPIPLAIEEKIISNETGRYFNALRVLRLVPYFRTLYQGLDRVTVTTFRFNLVISVTSFALMIHVLACTFYFVSECNTSNATQPCAPDTWTNEFVMDFLNNDLSDDNLLRYKWYLRSLFWVVATMSTTGFGQIVAVSLLEVGMSIICILFGAFILAIVLSLFTQGLTSLNLHESDYLYQLKVDSRYLRSIGLSRHRQSSFEEWFLTRWQFSRGVSFNEAVEILPLSMRNHVNLALYNEALTQVPLFDGLEQRFFLTLASLLEHTVYLEGQTVAFEGDRGIKLFIVSSGRVSGYRINRYNQPKLIRWYTEGCMFGRLPVFFYDETYTKNYRAEVLSEILVLRKQSLFYLARFFPAFALRLQLYIEANYDKRMGGYTIFDNPPEDEEAETTDPIKLMFKNATTQIPEEVLAALKFKIYGAKLKSYYEIEEEKEDEEGDDAEDEEEEEEELEVKVEEDVPPPPGSPPPPKRDPRIIIVPKGARGLKKAVLMLAKKSSKVREKPKRSPKVKAMRRKTVAPTASRELRRHRSRRTLTTTSGRPRYNPPAPVELPSEPEELNWRKIREALAKAEYKAQTKADIIDMMTMGQRYLKHRRRRNRNRYRL